MEEINKLILAIKQGDDEKLILIYKRLQPLINKYKRILFKNDPEDVEAEMKAAIWIAISGIEYYDNPAKYMVYLKNALHNKFLELYRESRKTHDNEVNGADTLDLCITVPYMERYGDINLSADISKFLERYKERKLKIATKILVNENTDSEIAKICHVSKQYVNKVRKQIYKELREFFYI